MRMPIISTSATGRMMPKVAFILNNIALAGTIYYTSLSDLSGCNKAYGGKPYQRNSGPVNRFGPLNCEDCGNFVNSFQLSAIISSQLDCLEAES